MVEANRVITEIPQRKVERLPIESGMDFVTGEILGTQRRHKELLSQGFEVLKSAGKIRPKTALVIDADDSRSLDTVEFLAIGGQIVGDDIVDTILLPNGEIVRSVRVERRVVNLADAFEVPPEIYPIEARNAHSTLLGVDNGRKLLINIDEEYIQSKNRLKGYLSEGFEKLCEVDTSNEHEVWVGESGEYSIDTTEYIEVMPFDITDENIIPGLLLFKDGRLAWTKQNTDGRYIISSAIELRAEEYQLEAQEAYRCLVRYERGILNKQEREKGVYAEKIQELRASESFLVKSVMKILDQDDVVNFTGDDGVDFSETGKPKKLEGALSEMDFISPELFAKPIQFSMAAVDRVFAHEKVGKNGKVGVRFQKPVANYSGERYQINLSQTWEVDGVEQFAEVIFTERGQVIEIEVPGKERIKVFESEDLFNKGADPVKDVLANRYAIGMANASTWLLLAK